MKFSESVIYLFAFFIAMKRMCVHVHIESKVIFKCVCLKWPEDGEVFEPILSRISMMLPLLRQDRNLTIYFDENTLRGYFLDL